ncbi:triose-phosphate isomerase TPI1 [Sugiyamaella lignohabitans]|uniref:Triosephosphate isomerase n=1 Tax=Sugiyamaella lignohabitans TaxID=796027 RepID=A0A167D613_9ASCO|nr:triose-phosphate isomerase TPI1 [Sugiyamaella lignohabitans]ANB12525.1 triose-phosphate isomerase TPI1 [Sugiyamaella lignohabitans]
MNGTQESIKSIVDNLNAADLDKNVEVVVAPPFPYLLWVKEHLKASNVSISGQNAADRDNGAFTGEVSIAQLKDVGASWVILGHSERRTIIKETDELIATKTKYAIDNGLPVILCIGETFDEKNAGKTISVVQKQLDAVIAKLSKEDWSKVVIAYEPVWAIGTGLAATPEDAQAVHEEIRKYLAEKVGSDIANATRIIYGGSVNGKNAGSLSGKADIDGFLVGGACLKPEFADIVNSNKA